MGAADCRRSVAGHRSLLSNAALSLLPRGHLQISRPQFVDCSPGAGAARRGILRTAGFGGATLLRSEDCAGCRRHVGDLSTGDLLRWISAKVIAGSVLDLRAAGGARSIHSSPELDVVSAGGNR